MKSNVITCGCGTVGDRKNQIKAGTKHVFLCDRCQRDLNARLADPVMIRGMMKAVMTSAEIQQMRNERENMRIERDLANSVAAAWAVAGYPRTLMLPVPEVAA